MRTHITTKYSDTKAFDESYQLFLDEYQQDDTAKSLFNLQHINEIHACAFCCEECGHEYYADWLVRCVRIIWGPTSPDLTASQREALRKKRNSRSGKYEKKYACTNTPKHWRQTSVEMRNFLNSNLTNCPLCGAMCELTPQTFASTDDVYTSGLLKDDYSDDRYQTVINSLFERIYKERDKTILPETTEKITLLKSSFVSSTFENSTEKRVILNSPKELIDYISKALTLEANLVSLERWLTTLYQQVVFADKALKERSLFIKKEPADKLIELQQRLKKLIATNPIKQVKRKNTSGTIVRKTVSYPVAPQEPKYETPGLFNKKKVEAENCQKRQNFETAKIKYAQAMAECARQQKMYDDEYDEMVKQAEADYLRSCEEVRIRHEEEIQRCKDEIAKWEQELARRTAPEVLSNAPEIAMKSVINADISQAEELLKRTQEALDQLYRCNIIFGKYRNMVALSTFYEYLMSGRCTTLDGPTGAYNLYESEIRANMIISQLSEVISNLEKIRENQLLIYNQLCDITQALDSLNSTMSAALGELKAIEGHTVAIFQNTAAISQNTAAISQNTAVIAHNTAATAYYAKKTAELTNALGYMVALK